jgi:hypothetical protein
VRSTAESSSTTSAPPPEEGVPGPVRWITPDGAGEGT